MSFIPKFLRRAGPAPLALLLCSLAAAASADPIAEVEILSVSPRTVAASPSDEFDSVASGLNVVGANTKVYLEAKALEGEAIGGATWSLLVAPGGSMATLSVTSGTMTTFVPDEPGLYRIEMTPLDAAFAPTEPVEQRIYAGTWVGAGTFNTHDVPDSTIPHCSNSCCHLASEQERLNVVEDWLTSHHADTLQSALRGEKGDHFTQSCLPCHTLGFNLAADNNGFDDIAAFVGFDLAQIAVLAQDAVATGDDNFPELPAMLQGHASVQCESCHGAGSNHMGFITSEDHGIAGVNLDIAQCAQCHDSASGFQQGFYQWSSSSHPITAELAEGRVSTTTTCVRCHTGEGYVQVTIDGQAPTIVDEPHGVTCATCHDPHGSPNGHQLRDGGDVTLDSGFVFQDPGNGATCINCHQSRVVSPATTAQTSSRGPHHSTQGDVLGGTSAIDFGLPFVGNSAHTTIVEDTCVTCHMAEPSVSGPGVTEPPLVGGHTYAIRDDNGTPDDESDDILNVENACGSCHFEMTDASLERPARGDYDGDSFIESVQAEMTGLSKILSDGILATMPGTSLNVSGKIDISSGGFAALTPDQKNALYNFNLIAQDGSHGVHNTAFAVQVLQRSYYGVQGHTITDDYPKMDLRGPVQPSTRPTPTPSPSPVVTPTPVPTPVVEYLAEVNILPVSPREIAFDTTGVFDETASGLNAVGVGEKMYLQAVKMDDTVTTYSWSVFSKPSSSLATLSATDGEMVTFRPDVKGTYVIRLTPHTNARAIDVFDQRIYAAEYVGVGVLDTHSAEEPRAPECGTSFCHGGNNGNADLNVLDQWLRSNHAQKLQMHMNGERGPAYSVSCLPCHTVGFNDHIAAINGGFDDIAAALPYDLNQIPALVADAANNGHHNFDQLPGDLQNHASIQCENCHGAGSLHPANLSAFDKGIDGANLDIDQCARCHDSSHDDGSDLGQGFYQWSASTHPITAELSEGHVAESDTCRTCHTGEGFVAVHGDHTAIPQLPTEEYHGVTCATCHDPHGSEEPSALRVSGDFKIPSGALSYGAGTGGMCFRCHNSRISNAETTAQTSSRGAHYGTQTDMMMGATGVSFGLPFEANSPHLSTVEDACAHCHMAEPPLDGDGKPLLVGGHTYSMRDDKDTADTADDDTNVHNACAQCHQTLTTYDYAAKGDYDGDGVVEGTQTEVTGLFDILRTGILATMPGTSVSTSGRISITSSGFSAMTPDQKRAVYNYNYVWSDGSLGVHNTSYAVQLLQRSYFGVYGRSIVQDYPDMYLRGPVQDPVPPPPDGWVTF